MFNSDVVMIALIVVLLFGAVSLYLYMYLQQVDQKVGLLESILLDLKVSQEIKSFELPASEFPYKAFEEHEHTDTAEPIETDDIVDKVVIDVTPLEPFVDAEDLSPIDAEELGHEELGGHIVSAEQGQSGLYDMSLKELQALAKTKGISTTGLKKSQLIDALKAE
jgi:hypothetical protein